MQKFLATALMGATFFAAVPFADAAWAAPTTYSENDLQAMNAIVDSYQKTVFDSYFGRPSVVPSDIFTSEGIQKELNAKNVCTAVSRQGARVQIKKSGYEMKELTQVGDWARFVVNRTMQIETTRDGQTTPSNESTQEGFLLKKVGGTWKIDNVFINPGRETSTMKAFMAASDLSAFSYQAYPISASSGIDYPALAARLQGQTPPPATTPSTNVAQEGLRVMINGREVSLPDAKPYIKNGRTFVPLRLVSDYLGAKLTWNESDRSILLETASGETYGFAIDRASYVHKNQVVDLDVAPEIANNRTMLPLRPIGEIFGEVRWDASTRTVQVNTANPSITPSDNTVSLYAALDDVSDALTAALRGQSLALKDSAYTDASVKAGVASAMTSILNAHYDEVVTAIDLSISEPTLTKNNTFARAIINVNCRLQIMDRNGNTYQVGAKPNAVAVLLERQGDTWKVDNLFLSDSTQYAAFSQANPESFSNFSHTRMPITNATLGI